MSMVENLLRLHRWQLEERRRYLGELESLAERLRADALRLTSANDSGVERPDPARMRDAGSGAFGRKSVERRVKLEHSVAEIEAQIVEARAVVAEGETEVAHYELAAAQRTSAGPGAILRGRRLRQSTPSALARRHGS
jgi:flagellar FliJ protein